MKKVRFFVLSIIAIAGLGISGCSKNSNSIKVPGLQMVHDKSKLTGKSIIRTPELNQIKTIEVGENIYQKINEYRYDTYDVIIIRPDGITDEQWNNYDPYEEVKAGKLNKHLYTWSPKGLNAVCSNNESHCWVDANKTNQFTYDIDSSGKLDAVDDDDTVLYKIIPTPSTYDEDSFKYQALYQGRIDNKIKISFREFKDDMARSTLKK